MPVENPRCHSRASQISDDEDKMKQKAFKEALEPSKLKIQHLLPSTAKY